MTNASLADHTNRTEKRKNKARTTTRISQVFLALMGVAFCKTGVEALIDPQAVMNNVGIVLDNSSAASSMRAVYGGMHLVFGLFCVVGIFRAGTQPLLLIVLYTAGFTIGRVSGIIADGMPNQFVFTWLITEVICGTIATVLLVKLTQPEPAIRSKTV
ncbi:MAG TPA: DUF4345 domain-containing protein [Cyclobacteriaceae bacterium]|nr:DUF4345 domain-containing protein [Cyclobacteriaceae bacterium]